LITSDTILLNLQQQKLRETEAENNKKQTSQEFQLTFQQENNGINLKNVINPSSMSCNTQ
jgi:hypothetical protein